MPNLAQMKALLSLNIGRDVGKAANVLSNAEIEAAIRARFPGAKITAHDVIPAQPGTKFGPFESTSRVTLQGAPGSLNDSLFGLSQDLKQQAIPGINHSTNEAVLAGPQAADWGSEFSKSHFVHPGDQTAFGNRQEDFKNQFTGGFYHGSPANNIEAFDPTKSAKDPMYITPKATFVTRDPEFAESFLSMNNSGKMKTGSTMYPVSVNLGQHWHPDTQEGQKVISDFVEKYPKRAGLEKGLNRGDWTAIENSDFLTHLKDTGHDTFHVMEGGIPNVGVLKPENIRGKFAEFNPEEAANPDFMKAEGGSVGSIAPYGFRHIENTEDISLPKGSGWFGHLPNKNGQISTEISADNNGIQFPMINPAMSRQEIDSLLANEKPTDAMYNRAEQWATQRQAQGKSPFIGFGEMRWPAPQYATGGKIEALKQLAHAVTVPFTHFSPQEALTTLDPRKYGFGMKGQEAARLSTAPDIAPRSFFYHGESIVPESGVGGNKYTGVSQNSYPISKDPANFYEQSRTNDPYLAQMGITQHSPEHTITNMERNIKNAGYGGYHTDTGTGVLFHDTPVTKID